MNRIPIAAFIKKSITRFVLIKMQYGEDQTAMKGVPCPSRSPCRQLVAKGSGKHGIDKSAKREYQSDEPFIGAFECKQASQC